MMTQDPVLTIELGFVPPAVLRGNSTPINRGSLFAKRAKAKQMRKSGYDHGVAEGWSLPPFDRASVKYVYHNPVSIDDDNFIIGMKSWLDGVCDAGVLVDDSPKYVKLETPEWVKCKRGEEKTIVQIRRLL